MSSKQKSSFLRTTTFRLTLWYLGVFSILSLAVFGVVYFLLASHLHDQTDLEIEDTAKEFSALYREHGLDALQSEFAREADSQGRERVFFELRSPENFVLATTRPDEDLVPAPSPKGNSLIFQSLEIPGSEHRMRIGSIRLPDENLLQIGTTLEGDEILLERYRETFGAALVIMLLCGGLVGWLLARKAMAGVKQVTETANRIEGYDFARRVQVSHQGEEISNLALAFNNMLERTESLFNELQRITDNIAHELRTPLTRMRGMAETTLNSKASLDEFQETTASTIGSIDDLVGMINTMLEISKTESGATILAREPFNFSTLVEDAIDLFSPLAENKNIQLRYTPSDAPASLSGDRSKLQRVVANLLDNAIKYTPSGGTVALSIESSSDAVCFGISDTGPGISSIDLPKIFDRFYRADPSRTTPGSGLGLSLAQAIVQAHGGEITAESTPAGTTFRVLLPRNFTKR